MESCGQPNRVGTDSRGHPPMGSLPHAVIPPLATKPRGHPPMWSLTCEDMRSPVHMMTHSHRHPPMGSPTLRVSNSSRPMTKTPVKCEVKCESRSVVSDSLVHGIFQARILKWIAFPFSRVSSQSRDRSHVSHIAGRRFKPRWSGGWEPTGLWVWSWSGNHGKSKRVPERHLFLLY